MGPRPFALWLIPEKKQLAVLQDQINRFCRRFGAPPFPPHLTLFAGSCADPAALDCGFQEWIPKGRAIHLPVTGVGHSGEYFKTLTLMLSKTSELRALNQLVAHRTDPQSNYLLDPHLSLLYKQMEPAQREKLPGLVSPPETLIFDTLALAAPANIRLGWRDILSWEVLRRQAFPKRRD